MNRKLMGSLLLAGAGLLVPAEGVGAQGYNPMQYSPNNVGTQGYPPYSGYVPASVPATLGRPVSPPSINYPAYYSPLYQPAYRATPPSINYPAYYHPRDFPVAANAPASTVPAANGYVPVSTAAVQGAVPIQGAAPPPINPGNPIPTASDWLETMHLVSTSTPGRQPANPFAAKPSPFGPRRPTRTAWIDIQLPAAAELWFEGVQTRQTGRQRRFESPRLSSGKEFTYTIRAVWTEKGKKIDQKHQLRVGAGDWWRVELGATWSQITAVGRAPASP